LIKYCLDFRVFLDKFVTEGSLVDVELES